MPDAHGVVAENNRLLADVDLGDFLDPNELVDIGKAPSGEQLECLREQAADRPNKQQSIRSRRDFDRRDSGRRDADRRDFDPDDEGDDD